MRSVESSDVIRNMQRSMGDKHSFIITYNTTYYNSSQCEEKHSKLLISESMLVNNVYMASLLFCQIRPNENAFLNFYKRLADKFILMLCFSAYKIIIITDYRH